MLSIQRILFPTDFSEVAERAFSHATHLADRFSAEIHVLNVVPPTKPEYAQPMDYLKEGAFGGPPIERVTLVHRQIEESSAPMAVLAYADDNDVDLIVMGTHGRKGLDRLFIGSVAEEVLRLATTPVLTVHGEGRSRGADHVERILVPVDFSDHSKLSVTYARELAASYGARVELVHVVEDTTLPAVYGLEPQQTSTPEVLRRIDQGLEALIADAPGANVPVTASVIHGNPVRGILDYSEESGADLIVIATHGLSGLRRLLMGSVSERIVRSAPCPVFTIKSFGKQLVRELQPAASAVS
jgi:nucleotide-binding universal stress UspA family protein